MKKILLIIILSVLFTPFYVLADSKYLYDVLKDNATQNGLTKKYTEQHKDSYIKNGSKDIYYWDGSTKDKVDQIKEKNNVIFGGFCWQTIRTIRTCRSFTTATRNR